MQEMVNSLIVELLKSPLFLFFFLIGVGVIIYRIVVYFKKVKDVVKDIGNDSVEKKCPRCDGTLILREGKFGKFYGCSNYPKCRYTEKFEE
jgi:hypothetical protein